MPADSQKPQQNNGNDNLMSLDDWKDRNPRTKSNEADPEFPHFCRMKDGVIKRLDNDDSLEEECLGSGFAVMVQLGEALIGIATDTIKKIETDIKTRIDKCLNCFILRR